jgi:exopolysaccharide biosynthesis polyprenyl glycosylphosphotransferase
MLGVASEFILGGTSRTAFAGWLRGARTCGRYCRQVALIGDNDEAFELYNHTQQHPECGLRIVGVVGRAGGSPSDRFDVPWLGTTDDLPNAVDAFDAVMIATSSLSTVELNWIARVLLEADVQIHLSAGLSGIGYQRLQPVPVARQPMFYLEQQRRTGAQVLLKRWVDVGLATVVLALTAPILAVAALAVKLGDRGAPVVYRQERVGKDGERFVLYKLRTMVPDAAAQLYDLRSLSQRTGPLFKLAADPRITRVGRLLRQTSIDELPQLVNVLRGEMSLVGPRPALVDEVAKFDAAHRAREKMKPGITGLWQAEARNNPSFSAYRSLDLFYLENWSILLDFVIMAATVAVVVGGGLRACLAQMWPSRAEDRLL